MREKASKKDAFFVTEEQTERWCCSKLWISKKMVSGMKNR